MKKNMKRTVLGLAGLLCALLFCGCGRQDDPVPSKLRVVAYVNQMCDEKVECIDVEKCEEPHEVIYTYRSKERDLEFEVISYRSPVYIMIDTEPLYYKKAIRTDYDIQVNQFYRERISALFEEFTDSGYDGLMLCSTSEVHSFAEAMQSANEIYREEISYNGKEYLETHSYGSIRTVVKASEGYENDTVGLGYYTIDGSETSAETYEESLRESILQKLRDGKAAPEAFADLTEDAAALHVSKLEHIYLDGKEMLYDENDSEYAYYGLITDEYKYAYYDYDADSYMMFMDCGLVADYTGSPVLVNAEYVHALGGTYEIMTMPQEERSLDLRSGWVIGDHTWEVTGHYESGTYQNLKVTRDGTDLQITAYEGENYKVISVTAADFCKLFDLTYSVDEEEKAIYFTSQQAAADL